MIWVFGDMKSGYMKPFNAYGVKADTWEAHRAESMTEATNKNDDTRLKGPEQSLYSFPDFAFLYLDYSYCAFESCFPFKR